MSATPTYDALDDTTRSTVDKMFVSFVHRLFRQAPSTQTRYGWLYEFRHPLVAAAIQELMQQRIGVIGAGATDEPPFLFEFYCEDCFAAKLKILQWASKRDGVPEVVEDWEAPPAVPYESLTQFQRLHKNAFANNK